MKKLILIALALFISACDAYPPTNVGNNAGAYYNRGIAYKNKGQYERAISDYTKALEINPRDADTYYNRGITYRNKGQYDKAITDFTKGIEINPRDARAYNNRGIVYAQGKGQYDKAITDFTKAIEIHPWDTSAYNSLSWLLATCPTSRYRDGVEAVGLAQKAVELDNSFHNLDTLAAAYAEAGNFEKAIKAQERAISLLKINANTKELAEAKEHLGYYKAHKPWREPKASGGNP